MATTQPAIDDRRKAAMKFIVCLGVVSLFADMTYEGAYSIIGPFFRELGGTAAQLGFVAGLGEMLAASLRYFSGKLADRTRAYWMIAISGYAINLLVIPALAFAGSWPVVALLVVAERTGKALRGPARDVLLSEATAEVGHGWGFGIHGAMDQTGAVLGPIWVFIAVARKCAFAPAFLPLVFPAAGALLALLVAKAVHPSRGVPPKPAKPQALPRVFRAYVLAAGILAFGFVDFPLLAFHFARTGVFHAVTLPTFNGCRIQDAAIPLLFAGAMGLEGLSGLLFGRLFDRFGVTILSLGTLASLLSLPFGFLYGATGAVASVACWALGMGAQDACLRSGISQVVSMNKRGSAFGVFNLYFGVLWFAGSWFMGVLYERSIPGLVITGVAAQAIAAVMFLFLRRPLAAAATH